MGELLSEGGPDEGLRFGRTLRMTRREVVALMGMGVLGGATALYAGADPKLARASEVPPADAPAEDERWDEELTEQDADCSPMK